MHILIPALSRFTQLTGICRSAVNHAKAAADVASVSKVTVLVGAWQERHYRESLRDSSVKLDVRTVECEAGSLARNLWYGRELPDVAKELKADLIHLSYPVPVQRSRFNVPVVATIHDLYPFDHPRNFGFPAVLFNRMFFRRCVNEADALVCVSEYTRERLLRNFANIAEQKPITTIYSYSELGQAKAVPPADFPFERFVLAVGQHRHNKNFDLVLRACAPLLRSDTLDIALVIAGAPGPETPALKSLVRELGIGQRVIFLHALSDGELAWLYRRCELFVAASSIEGFCLPLLEACELSMRVVCSDIPVFREIATSDCELFSLRDPVDARLAGAISRALARPPKRNLVPAWPFTRIAASRDYEVLYSQLAGYSERVVLPVPWAS